MNLKRIGIVTIIAAIFILGIGIGLQLTNPDLDNGNYSIIGGILTSIGLIIIVIANKKEKK